MLTRTDYLRKFDSSSKSRHARINDFLLWRWAVCAVMLELQHMQTFSKNTRKVPTQSIYAHHGWNGTYYNITIIRIGKNFNHKLRCDHSIHFPHLCVLHHKLKREARESVDLHLNCAFRRHRRIKMLTEQFQCNRSRMPAAASSWTTQFSTNQKSDAGAIEILLFINILHLNNKHIRFPLWESASWRVGVIDQKHNADTAIATYIYYIYMCSV